MYEPTAESPVVNGLPVPARVVNPVSDYHCRFVPVAIKSGTGLPKHIAVSEETGATGTGLMINVAAVPGPGQALMV